MRRGGKGEGLLKDGVGGCGDRNGSSKMSTGI